MYSIATVPIFLLETLFIIGHIFAQQTSLHKLKMISRMAIKISLRSVFPKALLVSFIATNIVQQFNVS